MKTGKVSRKFVYFEDYLFNFTFRFTQHSSRLHISFGEPIPIRELQKRGIARRSQLATYLHKETGRLIVLFPTQQVGYALDPIETNSNIRISELAKRMSILRERAQELGERYVQYLPKEPIDAIAQAHAQFWQPPTRKIARFDGPRVKVYRPDVLKQYANHARHLLEE